MTTKFRLVRTPLNEGSAGFGGESEGSLFGEQLEWGRAIAAMYRALAAPLSGQTFPTPPSVGDEVYAACAYWTPLLHLLIYTLGWSRPDLGMHWWYQAGKPTNDPRLAFISEVWDRDGQLEWFSGWLSSREEPLVSPIASFMPHRTSSARIRVDSSQLESLERRAEEGGIPNPLSGGSDPLHLSGHCTGPLELDGTPALILHSDVHLRHASLILDGTAGWYANLASAADRLPDLGSRSWYIDVTTKSAGWLGTYRRSRETALLFAGRHSLHMRGNGS